MIGERLAAAVATVPTWLALAGLTAAGAVVRLVGLATTAPELTDRLTAPASERPWAAAIGLDGLRASSPPLFVAAAKLVGLGGVDRLADHVVSALAGAATIPVVYAIGARLLGRPVGLAAAVLLAVSPVHLALSRGGEPAAAGLLVVAVSYLALVALVRSGRRDRAWLALYAASLVTALYTDPATAYAIAPQLLVGLALLRRDGRGRAGVLTAGGVALLAGLPWLLRLPDAATAIEVDQGRDLYLTRLWDRLVDALPLAVGLDGLGSWIRVDRPVWVVAPAAVLLLGVVPAGIAGLAALRGRRPAELACRATIVGAPLLVVLASLFADGLAPSTLAPALIGWSILASAWLARGDIGVVVRRWGAIGWSALVLASLLALPASYGSRQEAPWRDAAPGLTSQAELGLPIFVEGGDSLADRATVSLVAGDRAAADGEDRWLSDPAYEQIDATELRAALTDPARPVDALWLVPRLASHGLRAPLTELGFHLAMGLDLDRSRLELWGRPDAAVGQPIPIDGGFLEPPNLDATWRLTGNAAIEPLPAGGAALVIPGGASRATYRLTGGPGLYLLDIDVRTTGLALGRATLKCVSGDGEDLLKQTTASAGPPVPGESEPVAVAILCPEGTESLAIVLDKRGDGDAVFQGATLRGSPTDLPTLPDFGVEAVEETTDGPSDIDVSDG